MSDLRVYVEGIGLWSPQLADFAALRSLLAGQTPAPPPARPTAATLPPNERRRAPASVLLAIEAAGQAVAMSGCDAATLACVFASSHGDQTITDYMCATLAHAPAELSPIRFHNSVHNAAAGYWTIATGCHAPSTAIAAQAASFGAGLLEAASQVLTEQRAVLLVCSDGAGSWPLAEVTDCDQPFACALVLAPAAGAATLARLDLQLAPPQPDDALPEPLAGWCRGNPSARSLALLAVLASNAGSCRLAAAPALGLQIAMEKVA
ncbi:MAG: beta-ketoacyl synthase chain length factor [Rhodanobacter sp.]|nr:beta-ketoacyl synthase chain length factor [Rhodanobacter sp.]